jgi:hypothetical protein
LILRFATALKRDYFGCDLVAAAKSQVQLCFTWHPLSRCGQCSAGMALCTGDPAELCRALAGTSHEAAGEAFRQGMVIGLVVGIIAAALAASALHVGRTLCGSMKFGAVPQTQTRDIGTQSPTTYTRWKKDPRFTPLAEHAWGAW